MEITETLYVQTREDWRIWLEQNHKTRREIWLIYYKKGSNKPRIPYDDAVEEALCFGWIDSTVKSVNEECFVQRFTPRNKKSEWSLLNIIRIRKLIENGLVTDAGLELIKHLNLDDLEQQRLQEKAQSFTIPKYILDALKKHAEASANFQKLPLTEKQLFVKWVDAAKLEKTRTRRITEMLEKLTSGLKIGLK
jgi:uncharacterized protein YdeI (YjbR/CyaY-like superfamily)